MNFLKRLFGGGEKPAGDTDGIYFYVRCDHCGSKVRLRVHKTHDLNATDDGYTWHKTILDSRCFRPIPTVVHLDHHYNPTDQEIKGGHYITAAEYAESENQSDGPSDSEELINN
jgi:DNA-directed RNA polymerase subunit RPC12/RpoP